MDFDLRAGNTSRYHDDETNEASNDDYDDPFKRDDVEMNQLLNTNNNGSSQTVLTDPGSDTPLAPMVKRTPWRVLLEGPVRLKHPHVTRIFPKLQAFPERLLSAVAPTSTQRKVVYSVAVCAWALLFYLLASSSILSDATLDGEDVVLLRCSGGEGQVWRGKDAQCGINGTSCLRPVGSTMKFKCPADCRKESWTYSKFAVGSFESMYRPFVIGGDNNYRADSFICGAAVHHGAIKDSVGGCGILKFGPPKSNFVSESKNGIESLSFDSEFPQSYSFLDTSGMSKHGCKDIRWAIIWLNVVLSVVFGYFTWHAAGFYWAMFTMGFWTVILASNPPLASGLDLAHPDAELVSLGLRRFLPGALSAYVIYISSVKPQLHGLKAHLSRTIFWLFGFWVGVLENFVFGALPLDRLTADDLNAQAGAWFWIITIAGSIFAIALGQAYIIWRAGKFVPYIKLYLGFVAGLLVLSMFPHQTLRIHHYILALIFLPGVGFKTTPSLFYQGILVGLFISGVARWGFDSIIQTYDQLRRGAPSLVGGLPTLLEPAFTDSGAITLQWDAIKNHTAWDRFSLIINDVERYRGPATSFSLTEWIKSIGLDPVRYYIRLAYANEGRTGDYTHAGVVDAVDRVWTGPKPGPV